MPEPLNHAAADPAAQPFVSILVPTYKRNELLCNTITCLLKQDYPFYEVIVVDQCPEHDEPTRKFMEEVGNKIRRFVLDRPNVSAARNFAFQQSRGQLIFCSDDDMEIPPDGVRRVVECYSNPDIGGLSVTVIQDDTPFEAAERPEMIRTIHFGGQFMSFRREVFDRIGGFYEWFGAQKIPAGEDGDFTYRAVQHGFKLYVNRGIAFRHCGNNATGGCDRHRLGKVVGTSDTDVFCGLVVYWRNRKPGLFGTIEGFWRGYHAYVFNRDLIRRRFKGAVSKNRRFFRLFRQVLKEPWLSDAQ